MNELIIMIFSGAVILAILLYSVSLWLIRKDLLTAIKCTKYDGEEKDFVPGGSHSHLEVNKAKEEELWVLVDSYGDDSVGIPNYETSFNLFMFPDDLDDEAREYFRTGIKKTFDEITYFPVKVTFSDEIEKDK